MPDSVTSQIALVTGGNRGLGFEVCRQLAAQGITVVLTARDRHQGELATQTLVAEGLSVIFQPLDITDQESCQVLADYFAENHCCLDILVNNAGINFDYQQQTLSADLENVRQTMETNLFGAWRLVQMFLPLLRQSQQARIVNVSSGTGSFLGPRGLQEQGGGLPAYSISKAALNALTVKLSRALQGENILVNAVCPGFTATYPGTAEMGARPVPEGAAGIVWAATLPPGGPTGGFFRDQEPLPW